MHRRGFLGGLLAGLVAAPVIVKADHLMKLRGTPVMALRERWFYDPITEVARLDVLWGSAYARPEWEIVLPVTVLRRPGMRLATAEEIVGLSKDYYWDVERTRKAARLLGSGGLRDVIDTHTGLRHLKGKQVGADLWKLPEDLGAPDQHPSYMRDEYRLDRIERARIPIKL